MSEHKSKIVKFRITETEYQEIDNKLGEQMTISEFCRKAVGGAKVIRLEAPEIQDLMFFNQKLLGHLGYIGNNINQIAHRFNAENIKGTVTAEQVIEATEELTEIRNMLLHLVAIATNETDKIKNKHHVNESKK